MTILGKNKLHYIEKVLLYTPIMVGIFIALSVWSGELTVGFMVVGLMLIGVLLNIIKKITGSNRLPTVSILIVAIGIYVLINGDSYMGIFYILLGISLIFNEFLKGKWSHICYAITMWFAVVAFILYLVRNA